MSFYGTLLGQLSEGQGYWAVGNHLAHGQMEQYPFCYTGLVAERVCYTGL